MRFSLADAGGFFGKVLGNVGGAFLPGTSAGIFQNTILDKLQRFLPSFLSNDSMITQFFKVLISVMVAGSATALLQTLGFDSLNAIFPSVKNKGPINTYLIEPLNNLQTLLLNKEDDEQKNFGLFELGTNYFERQDLKKKVKEYFKLDTLKAREEFEKENGEKFQNLIDKIKQNSATGEITLQEAFKLLESEHPYDIKGNLYVGLKRALPVTLLYFFTRFLSQIVVARFPKNLGRDLFGSLRRPLTLPESREIVNSFFSEKPIYKKYMPRAQTIIQLVLFVLFLNLINQYRGPQTTGSPASGNDVDADDANK